MDHRDARHPGFETYVTSGRKALDVYQEMTRPARRRLAVSGDQDVFVRDWLSQTAGGVLVMIRPGSERERPMYLLPIRVPEGQRGYGLGTAVMRAVCDVADVMGWTLRISDVYYAGRSYQADLIAFYAGFGFRVRSDRDTNGAVAGYLERRPGEHGTRSGRS